MDFDRVCWTSLKYHKKRPVCCSVQLQRHDPLPPQPQYIYVTSYGAHTIAKYRVSALDRGVCMYGIASRVVWLKGALVDMYKRVDYPRVG